MQDKTRSPTEFILEGRDKSAILHATSYHRRDYDLAVVCFKPADSQPVQQSLSQPFPKSPIVSLGLLDLLPLEILHEICLALDIRSPFHFRQVNKRSRHVVGALREYQPTIEHGLDAFRAFLKTGAARYTLISDFFAAFCLQYCSFCGAFGGFVFLLSCTSCCFECLQSTPQLRTSTLASAAKRSGIAPKLLRETTRSLRSLPGRYSMQVLSWMRRSELVVDDRAPVPTPNGRIGLSGYPATPGTIETFLAAANLPYFDGHSKLMQRGVSCKGCRLAADIGLVSSTGNGRLYLARDLLYSHEGVLQHFQWCAQAQEIWLKSP